MTTAQAIYADTKRTLEEIQRQPVEAQKTILTMLRGAIAISDLYRTDTQPPAERPRA